MDCETIIMKAAVKLAELSQGYYLMRNARVINRGETKTKCVTSKCHCEEKPNTEIEM